MSFNSSVCIQPVSELCRKGEKSIFSESVGFSSLPNVEGTTDQQFYQEVKTQICRRL